MTLKKRLTAWAIVRHFKKWRKPYMSEVGDANQARIAAARANAEVQQGILLVVPAKAPTAAGVEETKWNGPIVLLVGALVAVLTTLLPEQASLITKIIVGVGGPAAIGTTILGLLKVWRKGRENAAAPGVNDGGPIGGGN